MLIFVYNTEQEINDIDKIVCKGESIGDAVGDITKRYADAIPLIDGTFGYISDLITNKYITDREAINN